MDREKLEFNIAGILARAYCTIENEKKTLDSTLCIEQTRKIMEFILDNFVSKEEWEHEKDRADDNWNECERLEAEIKSIKDIKNMYEVLQKDLIDISDIWNRVFPENRLQKRTRNC